LLDPTLTNRRIVPRSCGRRKKGGLAELGFDNGVLATFGLETGILDTTADRQAQQFA
jgi:hypothetical protein